MMLNNRTKAITITKAIPTVIMGFVWVSFPLFLSQHSLSQTNDCASEVKEEKFIGDGRTRTQVVINQSHKTLFAKGAPEGRTIVTDFNSRTIKEVSTEIDEDEKNKIMNNPILKVLPQTWVKKISETVSKENNRNKETQKAIDDLHQEMEGQKKEKKWLQDIEHSLEK
jgi:hypothetical protein